MTSNFDRCLGFVLQWEGGYVDHPKDPGGATNMGITHKTLSAWRRVPVTKDDVRALTRGEAALIYEARYWIKVWGSHLPEGIDLVTFDWAVNSGPRRAVRALQRTIDATPDGWMGPKTMGALRRTLDVGRGVKVRIVDEMCDRRQAFYEGLRTWPTFGKGWTRRNEACRELGQEMARGGG